jgi:hypothetical protein
MKFRHCMLICFLVFTATASSDSDRRDGNYWKGMTRVEKSTYITGFFDGIGIGNRFSYWDLLNTESGKKSLPAVKKSFDGYMEKYMDNVTNVQIADGLDVFYDDYRNRKITTYNAVWLVLNSIAGKNDKEMEIMIESFRKNTH